MGLIHAIGAGPVCLDTSIFIYYIEEHKDYLPLVDALFKAMDRGTLAAVTSTITLLETIVVPLREGDIEMAEMYERLLSHGIGLTLVDLDRSLLRAAAKLRALYQMKTPDALQVAAALKHNCQVFLTNDRRIPKIPGLRVLQLSDYFVLPKN